MKLINILASAMLAGAVILAVSPADAQNRKTTTTKKSTAKTTAKKPASAAPVSLVGNYYEGILKLPGQPMDAFCTLNMSSATEAELGLMGTGSMPINYSATNVGGKMTIKLSNQAIQSTLTSTDKGSSLAGSLSLPSAKGQLWLVKVNEDHATPTASDDELATIVGSPDGYTAFVICEQGGQQLSLTADCVLKGADKTWSVTFDNATAQQLLGDSQGTYTVKDGKLLLEDAKGSTTTASIYDDGTYITVPMGSGNGFKFTMVLVR